MEYCLFRPFVDGVENAELSVDFRSVSEPLLELGGFLEQHGVHRLRKTEGAGSYWLKTCDFSSETSEIYRPLRIRSCGRCSYSTDNFKTENVNANLERGVWKRNNEWRNIRDNCISQRYYASRSVCSKFVGATGRDHQFGNLGYLGTAWTIYLNFSFFRRT